MPQHGSLQNSIQQCYSEAVKQRAGLCWVTAIVKLCEVLVSSVVATLLCFSIWDEVWLRLASCSLLWWSWGLVIRVLPLCTQEHSRHTNNAMAVPLLQCWLDKSLSAGLLPLKRRSCASPLVNDLTHFFPLQSFHKPLLLGCRSYSSSPFPPSWFLPPQPRTPTLYTFAHTLQADGGKGVYMEEIFPFPMQPSIPQKQHGINKFNKNWKLMKYAPPPPSWLPATGKKAEHRAPWDEAKKAREWDHCHNYTIKSSSQQNHKTGLLSGVWPGWLATTYPAFLCDTVLCHFLHSDTKGWDTSEEEAFT